MSDATIATTIRETMRKVADIGALAGYKLYPHDAVEDMLVCPFDMGNGRSQTVYVMAVGPVPGGQQAVAFMSPCQALKKGLLSGMGRKQALDLLQRNATLLVGSFAIQNFGEIDVLVVRSVQVVDTMEVEEFRLHVCGTASIADGYEAEHGSDVF